MFNHYFFQMKHFEDYRSMCALRVADCLACEKWKR